MYGQVDIEECEFGMLGAIALADYGPCTWSNYYIDYPIYEVGVQSLNWGGSYIAEKCFCS